VDEAGIISTRGSGAEEKFIDSIKRGDKMTL
jgi:hypothetical protein